MIQQFTTPFLNTTTNYYVDAFPSGCTSGTRTMITATINEIPSTNFIQPSPVCQNTSATIDAFTSVGTINWFDTATSTTSIFTGNSFTTPQLNVTTTYFFEANNNGCPSTRTAVTIQVNPVPIVIDETITFCENASTQLHSGISGENYLWSTGETTENISITTAGNYSVVITNSFGCSATKNFIVTTNPIPQIDFVDVQFEGITINTSNSGDFLYSINGIDYFISNEFSLSIGGLYTAYVKDVFECDIAILPFVFIATPTYFTPNNDGFNDFWFIKGTQFYPSATTSIFDRYGKLIATLNASNLVWDGNFNNQILPASDYWFITEIPETNQIIKGHFSLKR